MNKENIPRRSILKVLGATIASLALNLIPELGFIKPALAKIKICSRSGGRYYDCDIYTYKGSCRFDYLHCDEGNPVVVTYRWDCIDPHDYECACGETCHTWVTSYCNANCAAPSPACWMCPPNC